MAFLSGRSCVVAAAERPLSRKQAVQTKSTRATDVSSATAPQEDGGFKLRHAMYTVCTAAGEKLLHYYTLSSKEIRFPLCARQLHSLCCVLCVLWSRRAAAG